MRPVLILSLLLAAPFALHGCGSPESRYGYSRTYQYLPEERPHALQVRAQSSIEAVCRDPERYHGQLVGWFGVVRRIHAADATGGEGNDGWAVVELAHRVHPDRNECWDYSPRSCRVTVDLRDSGTFKARIRLEPEDWEGDLRLRPGSLLKVYGTLTSHGCDATGAPLIDAQYYRHWPWGLFIEVMPGRRPMRPPQ